MLDPAKTRSRGRVHLIKYVQIYCLFFQNLLKISFSSVYLILIPRTFQLYLLVLFHQFSREVTILAKLTKTHSHRIVRYHTAWLEEKDFSEPDTTESDDGGSHSSKPLTKYVLYIQMELCSKTLLIWLEDRNKKSQKDCKDGYFLLHNIYQLTLWLIPYQYLSNDITQVWKKRATVQWHSCVIYLIQIT